MGQFSNIAILKYGSLLDYRKHHPGFYNFINENSKNRANKSFIKSLNNFREKELLEEVENSIKEEQKVTDCDEYKCKLDETMNNIVCNLPFFDKNLKLDDEKMMHYAFLLIGDSKKQLFDSYIDSIKRSLEYAIHENIKNKTETTIFLDPIEMANSIINFNPDEASDLSIVYYLDDEKIIADIRKIKVSKKQSLPRGLFYKNDSICVNGIYYSENSFVRPLSDKEIEEYIDKNYTETNGMYRYSLYPNDSQRCFMVSRSKLVKIIKDSALFCNVVFKLRVEVNNGAHIFKLKK